ncbi:hypothetical protein FIBSPDRAFT_318303 [Athelia psychrophila]|uniref:Uncharacterized protein n=1 Tax=Athelia psychrophila TaxID=1759441 RepID=A0A167WTI7_9AGAM|nr:hypothetical protein FIBSPDRAFT_318303 [Fibularhizoctonia sp. CBS 109695]
MVRCRLRGYKYATCPPPPGRCPMPSLDLVSSAKVHSTLAYRASSLLFLCVALPPKTCGPEALSPFLSECRRPRLMLEYSGWRRWYMTCGCPREGQNGSVEYDRALVPCAAIRADLPPRDLANFELFLWQALPSRRERGRCTLSFVRPPAAPLPVPFFIVIRFISSHSPLPSSNPLFTPTVLDDPHDHRCHPLLAPALQRRRRPHPVHRRRPTTVIWKTAPSMPQ